MNIKTKIENLLRILLENMHERRKVILALSCLVVFVTTYTLILPAFTLEKEKAVQQGGIDLPFAEETMEVADTDVPEAAPAVSDATDEDANTDDPELISDDTYIGDGLIYDAENYTVAIDDKHGQLTDTTFVEVEEITADNKKQADEYQTLYDNALEAVRAEDDSLKTAGFKFAKFYSIALKDGGSIVEPGNSVDVTISYDKALQKELQAEDPDKVQIIRFDEDKNTGELSPTVLDSNKVEIKTENNKVETAAFEADGLTVYGVTYAEEGDKTDVADSSTEEETAAANTETEGTEEKAENSDTIATDGPNLKLKALKKPRALAATNESDELEHHKTLTPNKAENGEWDGTYTLSLDIVGKQISEQSTSTNKADIILVLDMSSSMTNEVGDGKTRFDVEKEAVTDFGSALLDLNNSSPGAVQLSVLTFGNVANSPLVNKETDKSSFISAISSLQSPPPETAGLAGGGQGTNWEDALQKANAITTRNDAEKHVIFISDGLPTLRNTRGPYDTNAEWSGATFEGLYHHNTQGTGFLDYGYDVWGFGTDQPPTEGALAAFGASDAVKLWLDFAIEQCYDNAKDEARAIVESGKEFYTISVFEDIDRMENLAAYAYSGSDNGTYPDGHYKTAHNASDLASIFDQLFETASSALKYENVKITDTLTVATKSSLEVTGHANDFKYYKDGIEWTDAPAAHYENGQVVWDLGEDALENATYTVTFTVWPNQDAYDAIMKLNNGDATEEDIQRDYPDVYANLDKDGDKYVIYSNGDAKVTYDKVTYENNVETARTSGELSYPRPTMETLEYKMKVAKVWKDSLYADNRPDSITFTVKEDGQPYKTITLTSANASATDPDRWEAEIPISPGIISDKIIDGVRLNGGHEYTVEEAGNSDYHYDFDPEVLTPMLDNGVMHFLGDEDGDESLSGTNHMRGSMTITKKVIDEEGNDISSNADVSDKDFTFRVSLFQPVDGGFEEITGKTANDEDAVWYRLLDDQGVEIGSASVINSGDTFTLKAGHSLRLLNLPRGLKYKIEEVTASNPAGFEFDSEEYDSVSETNDNTVELTPDADGYCVAQPNTWQYVTVTNKKVEQPVGSIKITKNVTVDGAPATGEEADGDYFFTITDSEGNPATGKVGDTSITDGTVKITVSQGAASEVTVTDVPAGTYTISEATPNNGAELSKIDNIDVSATSSKNITVEKDKTASISFTNDMSSANTDESTSLTVSKKWLDKDGAELPASETANKSIKYRVAQLRAATILSSMPYYPVVVILKDSSGSVTSKKTYYMKSGQFPSYTIYKTDTGRNAFYTVKVTEQTSSRTKVKEKIEPDPNTATENDRFHYQLQNSLGGPVVLTVQPEVAGKTLDRVEKKTGDSVNQANFIRQVTSGNDYEEVSHADVVLSANDETVNFTLDGVTYSAANSDFNSVISNLPLYKRDGSNFYVYKYEVTEVEADGQAVTAGGNNTGSSENYTVTYETSADGSTVTINNKAIEQVEAEITIKKVDMEGNKLTGATFVLIAVDENGVPYDANEDGQLDEGHYNSGILPVDENGVITFSSLTPGNYLLSEYDTPNGYARIGGGTWYVTVDAEGNANLADSMTGNDGITKDQDNDNTFIVKNEPLENYEPNPPKPDLEHHKRIDALRDKTANPDTDLDTTASADELTDLYRVYLDYTINSLQEPNGVDLLFVIDHSGSMNNTAYGGNASRAPAVMRVLNGPNGNDGIIKDFLDMNEHNTWAAVGFKGDSGLLYNRVVPYYPWVIDSGHRAANAGRNHSENLSTGWSSTPSRISLPNEGYAILTNYTAGFWRAEQMLFQDDIKNDGKKKVIIFISDGIPTLNIPNLGGTLANAGTADGSRYYPDSDGGCMPEALEQFGYFVNDMKNNGYKFGDNTEMYAIGFGDSILASEEGQQLLKDMLNSAYGKKTDENFVGINDPRTGYDPVEKLEKALSIIIGKTESFDHVKVEDTLSDYIDLYGSAGAARDLSSSNAKVTMKPDPSTPTDPDSELVLYENGAITTAGSNIIERVEFNPDTKTVSTEFKDDYKAQLGYTYTLSFDVIATDKAYEDYADADNSYTNKGALDTDYGTNKSSSDKSGFYSNAQGKITYTHNDNLTPTVEEYEHPVIQIFNAPMTILKVDQAMQPVGGAKFNLYSSGYDPKKAIDDPANVACLLKTDLESTIKTLPDGSKGAEVTTDKLKHGTYWLVETDAPDNYFDLEGPIKIDVSVVSTEGSDTVSVKAYMNGVEIKNPYLISAAGSDDWVLKVENKQGVELPHAGGIGTTIFYVLGSLLVIGSAVFLVARRRITSDQQL